MGKRGFWQRSLTFMSQAFDYIYRGRKFTDENFRRNGRISDEKTGQLEKWNNSVNPPRGLFRRCLNVERTAGLTALLIGERDISETHDIRKRDSDISFIRGARTRCSSTMHFARVQRLITRPIFFFLFFSCSTERKF